MICSRRERFNHRIANITFTGRIYTHKRRSSLFSLRPASTHTHACMRGANTLTCHIVASIISIGQRFSFHSTRGCIGCAGCCFERASSQKQAAPLHPLALFLSRSLSLSAALASSVSKCRSPWLSLSPRSLGDSGKSTAGRRDVSDALSQSERTARLEGTSLAKLSSSLAEQPQPRGVGRSSGWFTFPPPWGKKKKKKGGKKKPYHILTWCVCQKKCTSAEVGSDTITRGGEKNNSCESLRSGTGETERSTTRSSDSIGS